MYGSCFLIHSVTLCLLIGAFIPLTFKVIVDRYVIIAFLLFIYLIFFLLFLKEVPLKFLVILVDGDELF